MKSLPFPVSPRLHVREFMAFTFAFAPLLLSGCADAPYSDPGVVSVQGRGAVALAQKGDPLLGTGSEAKKVSTDFAKGYAKADIDNAKKEYFERLHAATGATADGAEGRPVLYDLTLPERPDSGGIVRAPRPVILSIVE